MPRKKIKIYNPESESASAPEPSTYEVPDVAMPVLMMGREESGSEPEPFDVTVERMLVEINSKLETILLRMDKLEAGSPPVAARQPRKKGSYVKYKGRTYKVAEDLGAKLRLELYYPPKDGGDGTFLANAEACS